MALFDFSKHLVFVSQSSQQQCKVTIDENTEICPLLGFYTASNSCFFLPNFQENIIRPTLKAQEAYEKYLTV
jgi:hypothetical protein